jgi:acetamidase/formamidase
MMSNHYLSSDHYHSRFDNLIKPALTIESGDTVVFVLVGGCGGEVLAGSTAVGGCF